jgi:hypothetical protein
MMRTMRGWARAARFVARHLRRPRASRSANVSGSGSDSSKLSASAKPSVAVATASDINGYEAYGQFIKDELAVQDARKASFEQRGLAVITTSGVLVTLLFAMAALSTKRSQTFVLPHSARTWLSIALLLFFLSAIAAFVTNAPLIYQAVEAEEIRERLREDPPRSASAAVKDIAFTRAKALKSAKAMNSIKGWALAVAMGLEALAVGCVAMAISIVL